MTPIILRPDKIRDTLFYYMGKAPADLALSKGIVGAANGLINSAVKVKKLEGEGVDFGTQKNRRIILGWLFTPDDKPLAPISSNDLTEAMRFALLKWVSPEKVNGKWAARISFDAEARWVLNWAMFDLERLALDPTLTMKTMLEFWVEHGYDINPDGLDGQAALELGAVVTTHETLTAAVEAGVITKPGIGTLGNGRAHDEEKANDLVAAFFAAGEDKLDNQSKVLTKISKDTVEEEFIMP